MKRALPLLALSLAIAMALPACKQEAPADAKSQASAGAETGGSKGGDFGPPQGEPIKAPARKAWMRTRGLAAFKVPDQVVFVDSFDTTAVGKISRRELRAQLRARHLQQTGGTR